MPSSLGPGVDVLDFRGGGRGGGTLGLDSQSVQGSWSSQ